jgi:hypothetical protein
MKKIDFSHHVRLAIAENADPLNPVVLTKDSAEKLGDIPKLLHAMASCYGSTLGEPAWWGGAIYLEITADADLFTTIRTMATDLQATAIELHENAQRKPPLPLMQAVTHPHCIELLRCLSKTYLKTKLVAELLTGDQIHELPHISLADFTEPSAKTSDQEFLRAKAIGVCIPELDANIIVLNDMKRLELPHADYPLGIDEVFMRVIKGDAVFVGDAKFLKQGVYRALPGGQLSSQQKLV